MERESFKFVPSFFIKLSFLNVFGVDVSCPPHSSGLAPNEGHEKRWHLGMARLPHGRTGHGASSPWRHNRVPACGKGPCGAWRLGWMGSAGKLSGARRYPKQGGRKEVATRSQPGMHHASLWLVRIRRPSREQARSRLLVVCAHMCRCLWRIMTLRWQPPYSNFHKT